jgi:hypothetical protein
LRNQAPLLLIEKTLKKIIENLLLKTITSPIVLPRNRSSNPLPRDFIFLKKENHHIFSAKF